MWAMEMWEDTVFWQKHTERNAQKGTEVQEWVLCPPKGQEPRRISQGSSLAGTEALVIYLPG